MARSDICVSATIAGKQSLFQAFRLTVTPPCPRSVRRSTASVHSVLLGGHARVGLEDNLYYRHGELATNEQLVERMVRILHAATSRRRHPPKPAEILGLRALVASTA